jgi:serine/threonine protein kinase
MSPLMNDSKLEPSEEVSAAAQAPALNSVLEARYSYRLVERLGTGGSGSVFLARCLEAEAGDPSSPPEAVAIKVLGSTEDPRAVGHMKRELAAMRTITNDRIPALYDWSLDGELAFVVLEYLSNGSLVESGALAGRLDEDQIWRLLSDLLLALSAAHRASVLHLDVKPSNVLLDGKGGYILTDFGVSHSSRMSKGLLHQGQIAVGLGTHGYRAPEQTDQNIQSFDLRTDLWGVGVTAWAAYTGIDLNQRKDLRRSVKNGDIFGLPPLSDVHLRCPPPLEEVIMGLLYLDPSRRPGGAAEVLAQVGAIASGFGLDSQTLASARRDNADSSEIQEVINALVDPLWASVCRAPGFDRYFVKFEEQEVLCGVGLQAHHTFLLLQGSVLVERDGEVVAETDEEGSLLGAISTLTGAPRHVTLRAKGTVWTCLFNEAELEQLVTCNPAIAVRMIRDLATRIANSPTRSTY